MTDPENMRKLFEAALRSPAAPEVLMPAPDRPAPAVTPPASAPVAAPDAAPDGAAAAEPAAVGGNPGLDEESAAELGALLDERHQRLQSKRRRALRVSVLLLLALVGGGYGWFIQSPQRVQAFREAMDDIRSVGDIASIVAKYNKSFDQIKAHSTQIDRATSSMGIDPAKDDGKDPFFENEMKGMMNGEGKTAGERNRLLKEKFGATEANGGKPGIPATAPAADTPPPPTGP